MMQFIGGYFIRDDAIRCVVTWVMKNRVYFEKKKIFHDVIMKGLKISFLYCRFLKISGLPSATFESSFLFLI